MYVCFDTTEAFLEIPVLPHVGRDWDVHRQDLRFFANVDGFLLPYRVCTSLAGIMIIRETFGPVTTWIWKLVHQSWFLGRKRTAASHRGRIDHVCQNTLALFISSHCDQNDYTASLSGVPRPVPNLVAAVPDAQGGTVVRRTTSTPTPDLS